jgi:toxin-antitoxin system PIN domain toxin
MRKGSSELMLLDVNVLMALAWPNHQFHVGATERLDAAGRNWATCALTELGFIRLSCNPTVVGVSKSPLEATILLSEMGEDPRHVYLESLPSPTVQPFSRSMEEILGSKQITDAYLLALALRNRATLLTFDTRLVGFHHAEGVVEVIT